MDNEEYVVYYGYFVYRDGRIYSTKTKRFLKPDISRIGYHQISLSIPDIGRKRYKVHRLIALLFCHPPNNYYKLQVNHIDGNKSNNNASNLEWCSAYENNKHARDMGLNNISLSNKKRWENDDFRKRTSKRFSEIRIINGSFKGRKNGMFRYDIHTNDGKEILINDVAEMLKLSYSQTYLLIKKYLSGVNFDKRLKALNLTIIDTKGKVNRPSKEANIVS